jgi:hypothetical protein
MRQRRIVLFALIVIAAFFLAYLALPINKTTGRTADASPAVSLKASRRNHARL